MNNHLLSQIQAKNNYNIPYYATGQTIVPSLTDMDSFPYTRYFRGIASLSQPVVMEREAGWRPVVNQCYKQQNIVNNNRHKFCWQYPCSTILPCKSINKEDAMSANDFKWKWAGDCEPGKSVYISP
jgi:hypothetical protein